MELSMERIVERSVERSMTTFFAWMKMNANEVRRNLFE
jgi:hypothetical protein